MEFAIFVLFYYMCFIYMFAQQSVNCRQQTQTQWYYVAYMGSRTGEKIFTNHRKAHMDASADRTVFNFEIIYLTI
jgi:hypothetical protein